MGWIWTFSPLIIALAVVASCDDYRLRDPSNPMDAFRSMSEGAKHDALRNYCEWNGTTWTYKDGITRWQKIYCQKGNQQGIPGE